MTDRAALRERLGDYFAPRDTAAGVVARRLLGRARADDDEIADHLIRQRRRRSSMDGSIDHALVPTAQALRELIDLGAPTDHAGVVRLAGFLIGRQNAPGRWGEDDGRGTGFFSPGPIATPCAPLALAGGLVLAAEPDARFAASCFTLRSVLRAGMDERRAVHDHVAGLVALGPAGVAPPLSWLALGAVALGPPPLRPHAGPWADALLADQRPDGTIPGVPLAAALDALAQVPTPASRAGIARALPGVDPGAALDEAEALVLVRALRAAGDEA